MILASDLKPGMVIRFQGQVCKVLEAEYKAGAAKLGSMVRTRLRSIPGGRLSEPHFRPAERLEELQVEQRPMEFLFADGDNCTFMNPENFEQVEIPGSIVGPGRQFLQPGAQVPVEFFEGNAVAVVLPEMVEARVASTAPAAHAQQDSTWKEAVLENGLRIHVPLFIAPGEVVRVEVSSLRYVERARGDRKRSA